MIELQLTFSDFLKLHDERAWIASDLMHSGFPLCEVLQAELTECDECEGTGQVYGLKGYLLECPKCDGYGDKHRYE